MKRLLLWLVRFYRTAISPAVGNVCRFVPSCSAYTEEAVARHGVAGGSWLAVKRLLRCHPFCRGGLDPVPEAAGRPRRSGLPARAAAEPRGC